MKWRSESGSDNKDETIKYENSENHKRDITIILYCRSDYGSM
jgi:hypothetical protein